MRLENKETQKNMSVQMRLVMSILLRNIANMKAKYILKYAKINKKNENETEKTNGRNSNGLKKSFCATFGRS